VAGTVVGALVLAVVLAGSYRLAVLRCSCSWVGIIGHVLWISRTAVTCAVQAILGPLLGWHLVAMGEPIVLEDARRRCRPAWRWPAQARRPAAAALS